MTWLLNPRLFPSVMLGLSVLASMSYAWVRDWPHSSYWLGAFILNVSLLFMSGK